MYDPKNEAREFVAEDRDEAVADAARFFGVEEGELRISDLDLNNVNGLAGRVVVVAAPSGAPKVTAGGADDDRGGRGDRGGRERGGRGRDRGKSRPRLLGRGRDLDDRVRTLVLT